MEGDRWAGARETRGREVYGRREKRGQEAGEILRGKLRNIAQYFVIEKEQRGGSQQKWLGTWIKGYGEAVRLNPCLPPPPIHLRAKYQDTEPVAHSILVKARGVG